MFYLFLRAFYLFGITSLLIVLSNCSSKEHAWTDPGLTVAKESLAMRPRPKAEKELPMFDPKLAFFKFDSAVLTDEGKRALIPTVDYMKKEGAIKLVIEGYCDERGSDEYNLKLGDRRAESAKHFLVKNGVSESRIRTISYGRVMGRGKKEMDKNRRVGFQIVYPVLAE